MINGWVPVPDFHRNGEFWGVAVECLERGVVMSGVDTGIDNKLGSRKEVVPVILTITDIHSDVSLYFLISMFCLAICFWMIDSGEGRLNS